MRKLFTAGLVFLLTTASFAVDEKCFPAKPGDDKQRVFEYTDLLSPSDESALDQKLRDFTRETSNQLVVVVVDDLCGEEPAMFGQLLLERWGIGQKEFNNGIVVLVKPTGGQGQRKVFIATGYGMEGAIPDATCKRIVEDEILPAFKRGDFAGGLNKATDTLMALAKGEVNYKEYGSKDPGLIGLLPVFFIVGMIIIVLLIKRAQVKRYAQRNDIDFWQAWWLLNQASRTHGGSWGGFTGGGWSGGGGGGGGGWSGGGFGGGSGGGGGAGGSW